MTPSPTVARLLELLHGVQGYGPQWTARCPAHEDARSSLSVAQGNDGRALLTCHAGCAVAECVNDFETPGSRIYCSYSPFISLDGFLIFSLN